MKHQYYTLLGDDQLFILRWPTEADVGEERFANGLGIFLKEQKIEMDLFVTGELTLTDVPMFNIEASTDNLETAFNGDPITLPQFDLFDYRGGKFVKIVRPKKRIVTKSNQHPWHR